MSLGVYSRLEVFWNTGSASHLVKGKVRKQQKTVKRNQELDKHIEKKLTKNKRW